jgi:tRNA(Met) cytidine acetyltransferase
VDAITDQAAAEGIDLVGASFGATADLLAFWRRCGLRPLHLGTHRNAASGQRAAVVLKPLSRQGNRLCEQAEQRLARDLPVLLAGPLQTVAPEIIGALLKEVPEEAGPASKSPLDASDRATIDAFADAHRSLEASLPALARLVWLALIGARASRYDVAPRDRDLLVRVVLQHRPLGEAAEQAGLSGRNALLRQLRVAVAAARKAVDVRADADAIAGELSGEEEPSCNRPR